MASKHPGPVLVTGANSGIGLATTLRLAERDWTVWGTVRSEDKAEELRKAASERKLGRRVRPLLLDVSDHAAVVAAWPDLPDFYAVVNNAGYSETGAVEEVSAAQARAQLDVNLMLLGGGPPNGQEACRVQVCAWQLSPGRVALPHSLRASG